MLSDKLIDAYTMIAEDTITILGVEFSVIPIMITIMVIMFFVLMFDSVMKDLLLGKDL
jgi:hypothetical protein